MHWSEALLIPFKAPGGRKPASKLEAPGSWAFTEREQRTRFLYSLSFLRKCMECTPLFVLDLGGNKRADFDSWSPSWLPHIFRGWVFMCSGVPWEMRSWKPERGKWVEKGEAGGKGGVPEITADFTVFHRGLPCLPLLTSKPFAPAQSAPLAASGREGIGCEP